MAVKRCYLCKLKKSVDFFNKSKSSHDGHHSYCKECQKKTDQKYWKKKKQNPARMQARKDLKEKRQKQLQDFVFDFLMVNPCGCGEVNPLFLEFDHLSNKIDTIANLMRKQVSLNRLKTEIKKCQVLCVKCHRLKTAKDFDWWLYRRLNVG